MSRISRRFRKKRNGLKKKMTTPSKWTLKWMTKRGPWFNPWTLFLSKFNNFVQRITILPIFK
jgi:hypothetical protein